MPITAMELIETHRKNVNVCDASRAAERIGNEPELLLIDVREPAEFGKAAAPSAINIPRGLLEFQIGERCADGERPILLHCKSGGRAVLAARTLAEMGYSNVEAVMADIEDLLAALK